MFSLFVFVTFQSCMTGPAQHLPVWPVPLRQDQRNPLQCNVFDPNGDGHVDLLDFYKMTAYWGIVPTVPPTLPGSTIPFVMGAARDTLDPPPQIALPLIKITLTCPPAEVTVKTLVAPGTNE